MHMTLPTSKRRTLSERMDAVAHKLRTTNRRAVAAVVLADRVLGLPFRVWRAVAGRVRGARPEPRRILVIRADRIGDMILATPFFTALKQRYPDASITCLASSLSAQLIQGHPAVDRVLVFDPPWFDHKKRRGGLDAWLQTIRQIRDTRFDMAIDLRGNVKNFLLLMWAGGVPRRVSFDAAPGAFLLTDEVPFLPGRHETRYFLDMVDYLGGETPENPDPVLRLTDEELAFGERYLRDQGAYDDFHGATSGPVINLHPGAGMNRVYKRWPVERWVALADLLVKRHKATLVVSGSGFETDLAHAIRDGVDTSGGGRVIVAAGEIKSLRLLASVLARCRVAVACSTGIIHLATAVGTPAVVLCGPEDPVRWKPLGPDVTEICKPAPCRPCREENCDYEGDHGGYYEGMCLRSIEPQEVADIVGERIA